MVFWLAILAGALFVRAAIQFGFYKSWTMLFNVVVATYVAIFLTPAIVSTIPAAGETWYGHVLTLMALAAGTFAILYGISYACLSGEDSVSVSFPRTFEIVLASFLGFLTGFLAFSFVALLICLTPLTQQAIVKTLGVDRNGQRTNISYVCWWCDWVNSVVAYRDIEETSCEKVIDWLEQNAQSKILPQRKRRAAPVQPEQSDDGETNGDEKAQPTPPSTPKPAPPPAPDPANT